MINHQVSVKFLCSLQGISLVYQTDIFVYLKFYFILFIQSIVVSKIDLGTIKAPSSSWEVENDLLVETQQKYGIVIDLFWENRGKRKMLFKVLCKWFLKGIFYLMINGDCNFHFFFSSIFMFYLLSIQYFSIIFFLSNIYFSNNLFKQFKNAIMVFGKYLIDKQKDKYTKNFYYNLLRS